ncbi:reverse transcriptase/maturase family protein [Patescibacteria group bacterium]|nr:reverse transcriptase/maturase family protein [Patescibacteria group bacterium]
MIKFIHTYDVIISVENLLKAWKEFKRGKSKRKDVLEFERNLMDNIFSLHKDLKNKTYKHGKYEAFNISDPKPRNIHKARVKDRLLHHAVYRKLYFFFDRKFISDSYSCRKRKGTHRAINRFRNFARKESKNHTKTVWVLKCDIRKFFASIDHKILIEILEENIEDKNIIWLLSQIIQSFSSTRVGIGLPLGNLTSQLLVNIYMNEFDQFMKHKIKSKYYIRYADDFVVLSQNREYLKNILVKMKEFLQNELKLNLHPQKVSIETFSSGVDYLGWSHFPKHRVLKTITKRRMFKRIIEIKGKEEAKQSYLGLLSHGDTYKLQKKIIELGKRSEN